MKIEYRYTLSFLVIFNTRKLLQFWDLNLFIDKMALKIKVINSTLSELNGSELVDTFIGYARQRHNLIGCSETRTVDAQSVLNTCIPNAPVQCLHWSLVQFNPYMLWTSPWALDRIYTDFGLGLRFWFEFMVRLGFGTGAVGATENARHENAGPNCRGGNCGKS